MSQPLLTRGLFALADAGVAFVVCGGVWCILQGVQRASSKLDLIAAKRAVQPPRKTDLHDIEDLQDLLDG